MASVTKTSSAFHFPFNLKTADIKDDPTSKAVGFCEVAMLSNPTYSANQTLDDCHDRIANDCVISIQDRKQLCMDGTPQINFYSPAIANLAVDPTMRRQGIATKLLKSAERYISQYWVNATTMGLYVSTSNTPAIRLYEKCGYHKQMTVSSTALSSSADNDVARRLSDTANGGSMWYMSKEI
jgi:ribosomal protein S18 acetylase RimI-like enzyme